jgi:hypothetical protein
MFLKLFLRRTPRWHWRLDAKDADGNSVWVRTVLSARSDWRPQITSAMKGLLKQADPTQIGAVKVVDLLFYHVLTTIYLSGLQRDVDWWTHYPSSKTDKVNAVLRRLAGFLSRFFKDRFLPDLLVRHRDAVTSHRARVGGIDPGFLN